MKEFVGKKAYLPLSDNKDAVKVLMKILDLKVSWGHERALVSPMSGIGQQWVGTDKLQMV